MTNKDAMVKALRLMEVLMQDTPFTISHIDMREEEMNVYLHAKYTDFGINSLPLSSEEIPVQQPIQPFIQQNREPSLIDEMVDEVVSPEVLEEAMDHIVFAAEELSLPTDNRQTRSGPKITRKKADGSVVQEQAVEKKRGRPPKRVTVPQNNTPRVLSDDDLRELSAQLDNKPW